MSNSCPQCSAEMPDEAAFCPGCGRRMIAVPSAVASTGFLKENVAGALAYITVFPALVFLRMMPFKRNHFVRFHSFQSIFLTIAGLAIVVGLRLCFAVLTFIPRFGYMLAWLVVLLVALAGVILWLVVVVKAFQGELFKLPVIGGFAEKG
ncbi:conserved membrane hypothetical protein [Candidatus Sulfotelmatobacter sp. SbA7]|jgi:uncharacterized membrane protein|nr:conserved membrane hypothetical protein [Candidatus Sulfotelmatobacter sp. SbA7]